MPPQVSSQVPQLAPPQQSLSTAQVPPLMAHPQVPPAQVPVQQSLATEQLEPSCAPEVPPQVLSQVPQVAPAPQQSLSAWQVAPVLQGGPQAPLVHTKPSSAQQSVSTVQVAPTSPQEGAPHVPLVQVKVPQQSLSWVQVSPVSAQPHMPALQMLGAQQSLEAVHVAPEAWQVHVMLVASQESEPQQGVLVEQAWPLDAQVVVLAVQVMLVGSQVKPVQHPDASGSQSPSLPAHAGWHVPLTQLLLQQSPFALQQS